MIQWAAAIGGFVMLVAAAFAVWLLNGGLGAL